MTAPILAARGLSRRFGGLRATHSVDLDLYPGQILGVIGPNGAGKSTLINLLTGHLRPHAGTVLLDGHDVTGKRPWHIAQAGVARTFQIVKPFRGMTVADNVVVAGLYGARGPAGTTTGAPAGAVGGRRSGTGAARPRAGRRTLAAVRRDALETLERVGLADKAHLAPAELSVADARRLELAKALGLRPRVLLLDEVLAGLRPGEIGPALELIGSLRRDGLALLMVEHVMSAISAVCDQVLVLHQGEVLTTGEPTAVLSDQRVIAVYLGTRFNQSGSARRTPRGDSDPSSEQSGPAPLAEREEEPR
ncbi:ABC transporter ATP-binding protein [Rugosimonospora africana]|uniref:ABC transporter ATP-binding protein n=1 Tax=Rugosimonospora africana TaxID=556532 RepID=A0A8J3VPD8_9ACTN|nr:ABC transporter ATP-binding protein [Rugosimonospora africana]GIH13990.1 ABC transporter ATP-binding protein [Rugosimonospora africana]